MEGEREGGRKKGKKEGKKLKEGKGRKEEEKLGVKKGKTNQDVIGNRQLSFFSIFLCTKITVEQGFTRFEKNTVNLQIPFRQGTGFVLIFSVMQSPNLCS